MVAKEEVLEVPWLQVHGNTLMLYCMFQLQRMLNSPHYGVTHQHHDVSIPMARIISLPLLSLLVLSTKRDLSEQPCALFPPNAPSGAGGGELVLAVANTCGIRSRGLTKGPAEKDGIATQGESRLPLLCSPHL